MKFWSPLFAQWWAPGGSVTPPVVTTSWVTPSRTPDNWVIPETAVSPPLVTQ